MISTVSVKDRVFPCCKCGKVRNGYPIKGAYADSCGWIECAMPLGWIARENPLRFLCSTACAESDVALLAIELEAVASVLPDAVKENIARAVAAESQVANLTAQLTDLRAAYALQAEQWRTAVVMAERKGEELQAVAREAAIAALREPRRADWENEVDDDIESGALVWRDGKWEAKT